MELQHLYQTLIKDFGKQYWWPIDNKYHKENKCDPRFEIILGAILTQNTAWSNVERALTNLKKNKTMELNKIIKTDEAQIKNMIKPSGFFNQKTKRIKNIANFLEEEYNCDLDEFFKKDFNIIRKELLDLNGIGHETADSILLYAGNKPIFVVDTYTKRICKRIPLETDLSYLDIQNFFQNNLTKSFPDDKIVEVFKEFHALIVELSKNFCKTKPLCKNCPLLKECKKNF